MQAAIEQLKNDAEVVEPTECEARDALDLDYGRKDTPGSPDLAITILEKIEIEQASVVFANVTTIEILPAS